MRGGEEAVERERVENDPMTDSESEGIEEVFRMSLNLKPLCSASWEAARGGGVAAAAGQ